MRGKIIQYNGADGSGTIVADGRQYRFALADWRGDSAPGVNRTVDIVLEGDAITAVTAVGEDVLLREKAAELGGKFGASLNKLRASIPAASAAPGVAAGGPAGATGAVAGGAEGGVAGAGGISADSVIGLYGKPILGAYVLFLLGTLAFNAVSMSMLGASMGKSLFDIASLMSQVGADGGGMIKILLLLAYASIAVPLFWRVRRAWFVLLLPLLAVLWAVFSALHTIDSIGGGMVRGMSDAFSLGFGFYLSLAAALVLAALGLKRGLVGP